jgi:hypothetical protein
MLAYFYLALKDYCERYPTLASIVALISQILAWVLANYMAILGGITALFGAGVMLLTFRIKLYAWQNRKELLKAQLEKETRIE